MTIEQRTPSPGECCIERAHLAELLTALQQRGYTVIGPTCRDGVIVYDAIEHLDDLPTGWRDQQSPGSYRLERRADDTLFGYTVAPQSWKSFLYPPVVQLWQVRRNGNGFQFEEAHNAPPRMAIFGARPCECHAIAIQDRIFLRGDYVDPDYQARRQDLFIMAVNCTEPGDTCFCASFGTGPTLDHGFDLALTEIVDADHHYFLVNVGSERGADVLGAVTTRAASPAEIDEARRRLAQASTRMGRALDTQDLPNLLRRNLEHPRWGEIANRCLSCGNCTLICPTCFCTTVEDVTDLGGEEATRRRLWDSCFTLDFSYVHSGSVRTSTAARYRQWLTHKLAGWVDQFGVLGCVGCGRCITWCPVGIDITAEVDAIRNSERNE